MLRVYSQRAGYRRRPLSPTHRFAKTPSLCRVQLCLLFSLSFFLHSRPQGSRIHSFAVDTLRTVSGCEMLRGHARYFYKQASIQHKSARGGEAPRIRSRSASSPRRSRRPVSRRLIFFLAGRSGIEFDAGERHGSQDEGEAGPTRGRKRNFPIALGSNSGGERFDGNRSRG